MAYGTLHNRAMNKILVLLMLLAGCAPVYRDLNATCAGYGFKPGSPEFGNCMLMVMQEDAGRKARSDAAFSTSLGQALRDNSAAATAPAPQYVPPPRSVHCMPDYAGGMICN